MSKNNSPLGSDATSPVAYRAASDKRAPNTATLGPIVNVKGSEIDTIVP
jgi:hypothetical protein